MAAIARNNAFGADSPSWNLSFPEGNLTASEILAYLPHWLKSVDVILRLVNHGGRSVTITHLLNKYRNMPTSDYQPNSTTVMMHYAMRRAGKQTWTIGTRDSFQNDREYDEDSLYVGDFRPPRLTHPKTASIRKKGRREELARNCAADPIPFKELARHVKEHPSNDDALDLTRCVRYAVDHPREMWFFPTDFVELVEHIGGPLTVTHSHLDKQLFARYDHLYGQHNPSRQPAKWRRTKGKRKRGTEDIKPESAIDTETNNSADEFKVRVDTESTKRVMRQVRDSVMVSTHSSALGKQVDGNHDDGGQRRSSRHVKQIPVYTEKDEDATDIDSFDADYGTAHKMRAISRIPAPPKDTDSDFEAKEEPESEDDILPVIDEAAEDEESPPPSPARGKRIASRKARKNIEEQSSAVIMDHFRAAHAAARPAHKNFAGYEPDLIAAACAWETRTPLFVPPPILSDDRLVIDSYTVYLYAQDGCRSEDELWASALSFYRFGGPRRHSPFRELYRLTEPHVWDTSDWAENVRWAKEQYKFFGVKTWTEYDHHLDTITHLRRQTLWVSEEVVQAGMWPS